MNSTPVTIGQDPAVPTDRVAHHTRSILGSVHDLSLLLAPSSSTDGRPIITQSAVMRQILEQARCVARAKASVLIEGESGTGKELLARMIHEASPRVGGPFVRVNCAALSESLVESELFGHEKGAFTGAWETRIGRFELANRGTLLLDEISETSTKLQAKLLRALEEEEFERVGGMTTLAADVRIVATTNRNLEHECAQGSFRQDLYYRLGVVRFSLPPLRTRREDIPLLASHFVGQFQHETNVPLRGVSPKTLEILSAYDWPGNARQLRNVIHRACLLARHEFLEPGDLPPLESPACNVAGTAGQTLEIMERQAILAALRESDGNRRAAAEVLGITTRTLLNKLNKYRREAA